MTTLKSLLNLKSYSQFLLPAFYKALKFIFYCFFAYVIILLLLESGHFRQYIVATVSASLSQDYFYLLVYLFSD